MINFNNWKEKRRKTFSETVAPGVPVGNDEADVNVTQDDLNFYKSKLYGNLKRYLQWLIEAIQKNSGSMNIVRKGFIVQEVMDALGLTPQQITRLSANIKRAMQAKQQEQPNQDQQFNQGQGQQFNQGQGQQFDNQDDFNFNQ